MNSTKSRVQNLLNTSKRNLIIAGAAMIAILIAGYLVFQIGAAGFFTALEPDNATRTGNAQLITDSSASGGKAIQFTAPTPPPPTPTPTPTPTPPPTGGVGCPPFPAFPDAKCTGYKHATGFTSESQLTPCKENDGDEDGHYTKANAVYDRCLIRGLVRIRAANIKITNSKIIGNIMPPAGHHDHPYDYQGLQVVDTEITPFTDAQLASYTAPNGNHNVDPGSDGPFGDGANYTCIRCHMHHGAKSAGGGDGVKLIDSFIDSITWTEGQHGAAFGINHGVNVEIVHNNLDCYRWNVRATGFQQGCSSALSIYDEGRLDGVLVKNNLLNTAGQYCAYSGGPAGKNVRFIDNYFGKRHNPKCGAAGPLHSWYPSNTGYLWQNNKWADGSGIVNP